MPDNEIMMLSSEMVADFVTRGMRRLDELSGIKPPEPNVDDPTKQEVKPAEQPRIVLINPATEQRASFTGIDVNRTSIETLMRQGYKVAESEGAIPSWVFQS